MTDDTSTNAMHRTSNASLYGASGVNIDEGNQAVTLMKAHVKSTYDRYTLSELGSFGGLYSASAFSAFSDPVLTSSTDGVSF